MIYDCTAVLVSFVCLFLCLLNVMPLEWSAHGRIKNKKAIFIFSYHEQHRLLSRPSTHRLHKKLKRMSNCFSKISSVKCVKSLLIFIVPSWNSWVTMSLPLSQKRILENPSSNKISLAALFRWSTFLLLISRNPGYTSSCCNIGHISSGNVINIIKIDWTPKT